MWTGFLLPSHTYCTLLLLVNAISRPVPGMSRGWCNDMRPALWRSKIYLGKSCQRAEIAMTSTGFFKWSGLWQSTRNHAKREGWAARGVMLWMRQTEVVNETSRLTEMT
jgi:hypothetical protein